ncbi:uncharacterized protein J3D65DRAFT_152857 [Phyllosticta citribraziliensis]|uniref:Uncharacterized protein n=1 Tax=Phyllosticta citribraziliensis TaxID=989973 RepID=A0ABR1L513_9PEZI
MLNKMVVKIASAWCPAGADAERHYRLHACALAQRRQPGSTQPYGLPIFITGLRGCCGESVTGNAALCCCYAGLRRTCVRVSMLALHLKFSASIQIAEALFPIRQFSWRRGSRRLPCDGAIFACSIDQLRFFVDSSKHSCSNLLPVYFAPRGTRFLIGLVAFLPLAVLLSPCLGL